MGILSRKQKTTDPGNRVLDVTASMQGSLVFQEPVSLRISGRFEGTLETRGDLTVAETANVRADVTGEQITVAGHVTGKVVAKQSLRLARTAVLTGEIWTPVLETEAGARIEGAVHIAQADDSADGMSAQEVAEYLEMDVRLLEQWAREGKIPSARKGDPWRFERAKIDEWVAAQRNS